MAQGREEIPLLTETGVLGWLLANHLRNMGEFMTDTLKISKPSADKLISYQMQVGHVQDILNVELDESYYKAYTEHVLPEMEKSPINHAWSTDLSKQIKFHNANRKWLRLLILVARKSGYLSTKKIYYPKGGEAWNSLMRPSARSSQKQ